MKQITLLFFFFIALHFPSPAQQVIADIAEHYCRSNPFDKEFSRFLNHLINDPTLVNKTMTKRSDTSFFYFKATYTQHNPFPFKAIRTEVILAERVEQLSDSIGQTDTLLYYQLMGYTDSGKEGVGDVKKEYKKFNHKYGIFFSDNKENELSKDRQVLGTVNNFFVSFNAVSPVTAAWAILNSQNENVFAVTFRFKVKENYAILP